MNGNQVVSTMFDINISIHMVRIVSFGDWNEDPKRLGFICIISYPQVAMEYYLEVMTWIHIVCLVAVSNIEFG